MGWKCLRMGSATSKKPPAFHGTFDGGQVMGDWWGEDPGHPNYLPVDPD
jgi:hypothetical protein